MTKNYTVYHLHTEQSLSDSCTNYKLYVDKAVELGQTAIAFTEHGNIYNWVEKKMYCDEKGIKYIHGVEIYLTEQLEPKKRDNYHTILIAKNYEGFKELNILIDKSTQDDHFYYKPRITFDEFLNISDNIIKISACLASPLSKYENKENKTYENLCKKYDYYELQYHNTEEQIVYNKHLLYLSKKYDKPLIAGTDTHSINKYKAECRSILQKSKKIEYSNEDDCDLIYKSYSELVGVFKKQNALDEDVFLEAIENTNKMALKVEAFDLDKTFKYPKLYDDDESVLRNLIKERYEYKVKNNIIEDNEIYLKNIEEEMKVFKKVGMVGFMLFMSEIMIWCKNNNIPFSPCRGSVGGSTVAYIIDIIDLNPIVWNTVFSRFCNEDRVEIGDIDVDISPDQRELVYEYIISRFDKEYTSYILSSGTLAEKGAIDSIARALQIPLDETSKIKELYEEDEDKARKKYKDVFYYFDGILNTVVSQSMHPAGIIASPVNLVENYGTFWNKGKRILCINMEEVHEVSLVKYDILGLKNIQIIRNCCELAGIKYPESHELNWGDSDVWEDILCSSVGVFQFESSFAFTCLKKFRPEKLNDLSLVTASIRPSGASYRDRLLNREMNKNPSKEIDELLKDNNYYLIFQEDTIKFLQNICGLSGSEADNIRRAIGRKQKDRLERALPSILEGYCNVSSQPREKAEEEVKEFLQILEDSADYQFGYNHSTGYSMVSYMCAYLRYHYPIEFVTAYLNNANTEEDIEQGTRLAEIKKIKINNIKFGKSGAKYFFDKETNSIYKGIGSVKFLNDTVSEELLILSKNKYETFVDLILDIKSKTSTNSRQLDILTKLDFFSDFGNARELLKIIELAEKFKFGEAKSIKKDKLLGDPLYEVVAKYATDRNAKGVELKSFTITDCKGLLRECEEIVRLFKLEDIPIKIKIEIQQEYLGYISLVSGKEDDRPKLYVKEHYVINKKLTGKPCGCNIICQSIGSGKQSKFVVWNKTLNKCGQIKKGDVINCLGYKKNGDDFELLDFSQII